MNANGKTMGHSAIRSGRIGRCATDGVRDRNGNADGATTGRYISPANEWVGSTKGAYRLLDNEAVRGEALSKPHWEQTRKQSGEAGKTVLMVQDITELDYSGHQSTGGLGPIGDHRGRGLMVHNTLAISAEEGQVLGLAYQQVWTREDVNYK